MTEFGSFKVTEKKCATCSFWSGLRIAGFSPDTNKPVYIETQAGKPLVWPKKTYIL